MSLLTDERNRKADERLLSAMTRKQVAEHLATLAGEMSDVLGKRQLAEVSIGVGDLEAVRAAADIIRQYAKPRPDPLSGLRWICQCGMVNGNVAKACPACDSVSPGTSV